MKPFRKILVDVDALADVHPAVEAAAELASHTDADVTLADVLPAVPNAARRYVNERVEQELADHRRERLAFIAQTIAARTTPARRHRTLLLRGRPADAMIAEAVSGGYDLLIRSHGRDLAESVPAFGPVDRELLRHCPCPVWIVAAGRAARPRRILAAVDAGAKDPIDVRLNIEILEAALLVRAIEDAELTAIYAWQIFGESLLRSHMSESEFDGLISETQAAAQADLDAVVAAANAGDKPIRATLIKGEPERVLPAYIRDHAIDLVVMGTVGRGGLAGLVTGNTAERVLHELRGSVLAVKPEGFGSRQDRGHLNK